MEQEVSDVRIIGNRSIPSWLGPSQPAIGNCCSGTSFIPNLGCIHVQPCRCFLIWTKSRRREENDGVQLNSIVALRKISSSRIFEDGEIEVTLRLQNKSNLPKIVEVRDRVPEVMRVKKGANYVLMELGPTKRDHNQVHNRNPSERILHDRAGVHQNPRCIWVVPQ